MICSGQGSSLGGLTYQQMIWYLVMTETIALATAMMLIDQEVKNGDVAYRLSKPWLSVISLCVLYGRGRNAAGHALLSDQSLHI